MMYPVRKNRVLNITTLMIAIFYFVVPSQAATDYTQDANIVSWWYLEEATGAQRLDGSTNNNDLDETAGDDVVQSADAQQGSYSADFEFAEEEGLFITDAAQTGLDIAGSLTIVAWIKLEEVPTVNLDEHHIVSKSVTGQRSYSFWVDNSDPDKLELRLSNDGSASTVATANTSLQKNIWYHVAAVYDGNDMRLYLNGNLDNAPPQAYTLALHNSTAGFFIGQRSDNADDFDGLIDEVAIFDRDLSQAEIDEIRLNGLDGGSGGGGPDSFIIGGGASVTVGGGTAFEIKR